MVMCPFLWTMQPQAPEIRVVRTVYETRTGYRERRAGEWQPPPVNTDCMQRTPLHVYMKPTLKVGHLLGFAFGWKLRMLYRICRPIVLHFESFDRAGNNSLLISRFAVPPRPPKALRNIGLFHMSDEQGHGTLEAYRAEGYDYVIRDYYYPRYQRGLDETWLMWLPTGPRYGVEPMASSSLPGFAQRNTVCNFLGTVPGSSKDLGRRAVSRNRMKSALRKAGDPCYLETTAGGFGGRRHAVAYAAVLRDSQFTLCPWGNHPETIRLWDSFETGSIPVMLNSTEFLPLLAQKMGNDSVSPYYQPVVTLGSWDRLPELLEDARARPEVYALKQVHNIRWWKQFKRHLARELDRITTI